MFRLHGTVIPVLIASILHVRTIHLQHHDRIQCASRVSVLALVAWYPGYHTLSWNECREHNLSLSWRSSCYNDFYIRVHSVTVQRCNTAISPVQYYGT